MLPTAKDTGIGEAATREANKAMTEELRRPEANQTKQMQIQDRDGIAHLAELFIVGSFTLYKLMM